MRCDAMRSENKTNTFAEEREREREPEPRPKYEFKQIFLSSPRRKRTTNITSGDISISEYVLVRGEDRHLLECCWKLELLD